MAASYTGTPIKIDSSANSGSTSITVPADATAIVVFWRGWLSGTISMSSLTIAGAALSLAENVATSGDADAVGVGYKIGPATGSQTFAWDLTGTTALDEGSPYIVCYLKDTNAGDPVSDSDTAATASAGPTTESVTLTTASTDFCPPERPPAQIKPWIWITNPSIAMSWIFSMKSPPTPRPPL